MLKSPFGIYDKKVAMEKFPIGSTFWTIFACEGCLTTVEGPCRVINYPIGSFFSGSSVDQLIVYNVNGKTQRWILESVVNEWHGMFADEEAAQRQAKTMGTLPGYDENDHGIFDDYLGDNEDFLGDGVTDADDGVKELCDHGAPIGDCIVPSCDHCFAGETDEVLDDEDVL